MEENMTIQASSNSRLRVMVFGAGTMGHGISLLAAKAGHRVFMVDVSTEILNRGMDLIHSLLDWFDEEGELSSPIEDVAKRIEPVQDYKDLVSSCDLIIEAISEDKDLKATLYRDISPHLSDNSVVTSNTSYLDVFSLAPEAMLSRFAVTHFFVPPHVVPLVEVVGGEKTDPNIVPWLLDVLSGMGQQPIAFKKYIPGLVVNRLQRAMVREMYFLLDEGIADPEQIDMAVKASLALRMPVAGIIQKLDLTGLDLVLKILKNQAIQLTAEDRIPGILEERVAAGDLGVKTGRGFYEYGGRSVEDITRDFNRRIYALRRFVEKNPLP
jgi:3-hydroxybutyryl-CoA dehydrogenase